MCLLAGNTALSYQMMIEEKLLTAMTNAEQRNALQTACHYAKVYCKFVGVPEKDMPIKPMSKIEHKEFFPQWTEYYFNLLETFGNRITQNLERVRKQYGKKDDDIPSGVVKK